MEALVTRGADVNARDDKGETPLCRAVERKNPETLRFLLDSGADINLTNSALNLTPLQFAIMCGETSIVKVLLERGASLLDCDKSGRAPLLQACKRYFDSRSLDLVQALVRAGSDLRATDNDGCSALHLAVSRDDNIDVVRELIGCKADLNVKDSSGCTPLVRAVKKGNFRIAALLITSGANLGVANSAGETALKIARKTVPRHLRLLVDNNSMVLSLLKLYGALEPPPEGGEGRGSGDDNDSDGDVEDE